MLACICVKFASITVYLDPTFWQESYAILNKYDLLVTKEESEKVDTLHYTWEKLLLRANEVQNELIALQPKFRRELISSLKTFTEDCAQFYSDYEQVRVCDIGLEELLKSSGSVERLWSWLNSRMFLYCLKTMLILVNVIAEFQCRTRLGYFLCVTEIYAGNQL